MTPAPSQRVATSAPDGALSGAQYSLFRRHEQNFCIDVTHLQEVLQQSSVTPVPRSSRSLAGVMNLRGEVLPVLLVDALLHLPEQAYDPSRPVLVLRRKDLLVGIQVDSVQRVGFVPRDEVLPSPLTNQSAIWAGIWFRANQELATLLDGSALLDEIYAQFRQQKQESGGFGVRASLKQSQNNEPTGK
jgi:chemotaxis signal transduction protein